MNKHKYEDRRKYCFYVTSNFFSSLALRKGAGWLGLVLAFCLAELILPSVLLFAYAQEMLLIHRDGPYTIFLYS